jgi:hypothetical protein
MSRRTLALVMSVCLGSVLVVLAWSLMGWAAPSAAPAEPVAPGTTQDRYPLASEDWLRIAAEQPVEIQFMRAQSDDSSVGGVSSVASRGPLTAGDLALARAQLAGIVGLHYSRWEQACMGRGTGPGGTKTMADAMAEMDLLLMAKRQEIHVRKLDSGDYFTFDHAAGDRDRVILPQGHMRSVLLRGGKIGGLDVDVVFSVAPDDPDIADLYREFRKVESLTAESQVSEFNARPFEERRRIIDQNAVAVSRFRQIIADSAMLPEQKSRELETLLAQCLPGTWAIDEVSCYARVREP